MPFHLSARGAGTLLTAFALLVGACDAGGDAVSRSRPTRPNVLLIVTDDQRFDPATYQVMPETMRLFRDEGLSFRNAVVTTPLCCPSRASIMSGLYAHNHGVRINPQGSRLDQSRTIQKEMKDAGYQTAMVGKYLQGYDDDPRYFDRWAAFEAKKTFYQNAVNVDGKRRTEPGYLTAFLRRKSVEMLEHFERDDDVPWMLYLAVYPPHVPATPEPKYEDSPVPAWNRNPAQQETDIRDKPDYVQRNAEAAPSTKKMKRQRRNELRSLRSVDDLIADVFDRLEALDEENTVAFFLSDNGYLHLEHQVFRKRYPYNLSVRVPMFLRWPGQIEPGSTDDRIVANIDIAATIYDVLELTPDYRVDGRSLLGDHRREEIFLEFFHEVDTPTWTALWTPEWEFIRYESGELEYYGPDDPWQLENVYGNRAEGDEPRDEKEMIARLRRHSTCAGRECP